MKQKVLSLVLAAVMLSTSVDTTAFASQASDVDSAVFMEEEAEETEEVEEEELELTLRGGAN